MATASSTNRKKCSHKFPGARLMVMALRRYERVGGEAASGCLLARLPADVLRLVRHQVVYDSLGLRGCCRYGELEALRHGSRGVRLQSSEWEEVVKKRYDSPMQEAVWHKHLGVVRYLVEELSPRGSIVPWATAFAGGGSLELIRYLVERGADINSDGGAAVRLAAEHGNVEVIRYLVERGADINRDGGAAVRSAAEHGNVEVLRYLVDEVHPGAHLDPNASLSHATVARGWRPERYLNVIRYLVNEKGADIHTIAEDEFMDACNDGELKVVKYYIEEVGIVPSGDVIRSAMLNAEVDVVKYFVEEAKVDSQWCGRIAVDAAKESGDLQVLRYLKEAGVDIDWGGLEVARQYMDKYCDNALEEACRRGDLCQVRHMVEVVGMNPNGMNMNYGRPFQMAVRSRDLRLVRFFLDNTMADTWDCADTALEQVCWGYNGDDTTILEYLIEERGFGVSPNQHADSFHLDFARDNEYWHVVDYVEEVLSRPRQKCSFSELKSQERPSTSTSNPSTAPVGPATTTSGRASAAAAAAVAAAAVAAAAAAAGGGGGGRSEELLEQLREVNHNKLEQRLEENEQETSEDDFYVNSDGDNDLMNHGVLGIE